ncbi:MAG: hypothetical protein II956_09930 [Bacteroidales bacterium]|nr:hypothetical protein [Bacteroidales bacterium]
MKNSFKTAVDKDLPNAYKEGLGAIKGNDKGKFDFIENSRNISGSADIDAAMKKQFPHENRWDYVIGYNEKAYFFEVHPMTEGEVSKIIAEKNWLENFLNNYAKNLNAIKMLPYFWLQTDKRRNTIAPKSIKATQLVKNNIEWHQIKKF